MLRNRESMLLPSHTRMDTPALSGTEESGTEGYCSSVPPDDRAKVWNLVNPLTPEDPLYRTQYRKFRPDGMLLWLEESGRATFDLDRKMVRRIGMTADITERKLAEEALAKAARYERLVHDVTVIANSATTMRDALQLTLGAICEIMAFPIGHALLIQDDEPESAKPMYVLYTKDRERFAALIEVSNRIKWEPGMGAPGEVMCSGNSLVLDVTQTARLPERYPGAEATLAAGLHAGIHIPVLVDSGVAAILEFASEQPASSLQEHVPTLVAACEQLARFFERRRAQIRIEKQQEELRLSAERLLAMARRLVDSQEAERSRIARDIHDDVVQRLAMMTLKASALAGRDSALASTEVIDGLQDLRQSIVSVAADLRDLSRQLRPATLDILGLVRSLRSQCDDFQRLRGVATTFWADISDTGASPEAAVCLYRILQEGLQNIGKHSASRKAFVTLTRQGDVLEMRIRDEGKGFDISGVNGGGIGLMNIRDRMQLLGGELIINSRKGSGTELVVRIPSSRADLIAS